MATSSAPVNELQRQQQRHDQVQQEIYKCLTSGFEISQVSPETLFEIRTELMRRMQQDRLMMDTTNLPVLDLDRVMDDLFEDINRNLRIDNVEIRQQIPALLGLCCRKSMEKYLSDCIDALLLLFADDSHVVVRGVIETTSSLYTRVLRLVAQRAAYITKEVWTSWLQLMRLIVDSSTHDSVGVRKAAVRFTASAIISFTPKQKDENNPSGETSLRMTEQQLDAFPAGSRLSPELFSVDDLSEVMMTSEGNIVSAPSLVSKDALIRESERYMNMILALFDSPERRKACSATMYMVFSSVLSEMIRERPSLKDRLLPTLIGASDLSSSLSNRTSYTQRISIEKNLRAVLFALLKIPQIGNLSEVRSQLVVAFERLEILPQAEAMMKYLDRQARKAAETAAAAAAGVDIDAANKKQKQDEVVADPAAGVAKPSLEVVPVSPAIPEQEQQPAEDTEPLDPRKRRQAQKKDQPEDQSASPVSLSPAKVQLKHHFPDFHVAEAAANALFSLTPLPMIVDRILMTLMTMPPIPPAIIAEQMDQQRQGIAFGKPSASLENDDELGMENEADIGLGMEPIDSDQGLADTDQGMNRARAAVQFRAHAPPVVVPKLSNDAIEKLKVITVKRLLHRETLAEQAGAIDLRLSLLGRFLINAPLQGEVWSEAVKFIGEKFAHRLPLALGWLFAEAAKSAVSGEGDDEGDRISKVDEHEDRMGTDEGRNQKHGKRSKKEANIVPKVESTEHEQTEQPPISDRYRKLLTSLMDLALANENVNDFTSEAALNAPSLVCQLLVAAPLISPEVYSRLSDYCKDPTRMWSGLMGLRDVVLDRYGGDRSQALSMLLEYSSNDDPVLRGPVVRLVATKLYSLSALALVIQSYVVDSLNDAVQSAQAGLISQESMKVEMERRLALFAAVCSESPQSLLPYLMVAYVQCNSDQIRAEILSSSKAISRRLGMQPSAMMFLYTLDSSMLSEAPMEVVKKAKEEGESADSQLSPETLCDQFVLSMTNLALEGGPAAGKSSVLATPELIETSKLRYIKSNDVRFLLHALNGLNRNELVGYLPSLLNMPNDFGGFKAVVMQTFSSRSPVISPSDFLVELHKIQPAVSKKDIGTTPVAPGEAAAPSLDKLIQATQTCFDLPGIYKQDVLAVVLQKVVEETPTPMLFMRTVIQTIRLYPKLTNFVMGILIRLIDKQVWTQSKLWEGFIMCCQITMPRSAVVLLRLPPNQLDDALLRNAKLREPLLQYCLAQSRGNVPAYLLALIQKHGTTTSTGGNAGAIAAGTGNASPPASGNE